MNLTPLFFLNAVAFGVGLAMDAFSVSMANGLNEPHMRRGRMCAVAGVFAGFQTLMPLIGWFCVHTIASVFESLQKFIPWIALILLAWIGGGMLREGLRHSDTDGEKPAVGLRALLVQGVATSIDALSVGFTIANYAWAEALIEAAIIGVVTFALCLIGLVIGRKFGVKLAGKASVLGGIILLLIGLEIFITGIIA